MRRVRYAVAMSLDGYIANPNEEADWIIMDPEIDFFGMRAVILRAIRFAEDGRCGIGAYAKPR
jgi:hypothetical protein